MEYKNEPLKIGDKFIRESKYGFVTGVVKDINYNSYVMSCGRYTFFKPQLVSENNIHYDLNECYKLLSVKTQEEADLFDKRIKVISESYKANHKKMIEKFNSIK